MSAYTGLWSWRLTVLRSGLRPEVRHVLLTVSCRMRDMIPDFLVTPLRALANDTGLRADEVRVCLREAVAEGWIEVTEVEPGYIQITRRT